jgi:hypothetical protein
MPADADDPALGVSPTDPSATTNSNTNTRNTNTNTDATDATDTGTFGNWGNQESWAPTTARDSLQDSLLSLTRRHSLPTHAALVGLLGRFGRARDGEGTATATATATIRDISATTSATPSSPTPGIGRSRSNSFAVGTAAADRYRYGHRHTRSEADHQPVVVVKNYPAARTQVPRVIEEEEEMEVSLPKIDDFSWGSILKSVDPQGKLCFPEDS